MLIILILKILVFNSESSKIHINYNNHIKNALFLHLKNHLFTRSDKNRSGIRLLSTRITVKLSPLRASKTRSMKTPSHHPASLISANLAIFSCLLSLATSAFSRDTLEALKEREQKVKAVAAKAMETTVGILSKSMMGAGSGVVVSEDGLVLTAAHVVQAAGDEVEVVFPDGRRYSGTSLGQNRALDAAMVQIKAAPGEKFAHMSVGASDNLELGQWCIAMGHPGGYDRLRTPPVRLGRVWSMNTPGMIDMLVSDCTLVGGDSGGPLFDLDGNVIGIHSSIGASLEQNRHVPVSVFKKDWERLKNNERWGSIGLMSSGIDDPDRPMLGIQMGTQGEPNDAGVTVTGVFPNSPADKSGVKTGDIVTQIGDEAVKQPQDLIRIVAEHKIGDSLAIKVRRADKEIELSSLLTSAENLEFPDPYGLGQHPPVPEEKQPPRVDPAPAPQRALFGAMMFDLDDQAEVIELIPGAAAEKSGIEVGDIILQIDDVKIQTTDEMVAKISTKSPGDRVRVKLQRGAGEIDIEVKLGASE